MALLTRIQARILEHEAALEAQMAEINGYEEYLHPDDLECADRPHADTRSPEERLEEQRIFHQQTERRYVDILSRIEELAEFSDVAMWRSLP